ncbi:hypothetical protein GCM10009007_14830 [Formosimonas limnophila]|uniref:Inhibitor of vertebrate lysozyme (Ivy) n=1 Tax=Formosimonas limnophila TaxID=1384487 RepID=A0A8J3G046_9BURK|nr:Ivy family c-type lysozyme inhibitor [Formosimonas limnophila]GHA74786.1 hypothetical protein GCM10009007_14830 [Formosimonas limnophila]
MLKKISAVTLFVSLLGLSVPNAQAVQITKFETLTQKQIEQSYYFDWNRNSTFRAAIYKAFKTSKITVPSWVRQGAGPAAPARVITSGATKFVLLNTCKARECDKNELFVVFDPVTKAAFAVGQLDGKTTWIGNPNATVKQILSTASGLR